MPISHKCCREFATADDLLVKGGYLLKTGPSGQVTHKDHKLAIEAITPYNHFIL